MTATFSELLPATKSSKHNGIRYTPSSRGPGGLLQIHTARSMVSYLVVEFATPWDGRAFHLAKLVPGTDREAESYDVFVCRHGQNNRCECKGYLMTSACKHIAAIEALLSNEQLWNRSELAKGFQ